MHQLSNIIDEMVKTKFCHLLAVYVLLSVWQCFPFHGLLKQRKYSNLCNDAHKINNDISREFIHTAWRVHIVITE